MLPAVRLPPRLPRCCHCRCHASDAFAKDGFFASDDAAMPLPPLLPPSLYARRRYAAADASDFFMMALFRCSARDDMMLMMPAMPPFILICCHAARPPPLRRDAFKDAAAFVAAAPLRQAALLDGVAARFVCHAFRFATYFLYFAQRYAMLRHACDTARIRAYMLMRMIYG